MKNKFIFIIGLLIVLLLGMMIYPYVKPEKIEKVDIGINPARGNTNSSVVMIEFSDFQCPACKAAEPVIEEILDNYDVAFYYRNFPLSIHKNSFISAEAAECANEQGKFWEYHDVLFDNQNNLDEESLKKYAKDIRLNEEEFNLCLDSEKYKSDIEKDIKDGKSLNIQGTPTFFINGRKVLGANKIKIMEIIEEEIN